MTNTEGVKTAQSDVTISGDSVTSSASEGSSAVSTAVATKIESSVSKTEANAKYDAAEVVLPSFDDSIVARIGTNGYTSLNAAYSKVNAGNTIVILNDVPNTELTGICIQKVITVDLNGHTVSGSGYTLSGKNYGWTFYVYKGSLTINDSSEHKTGKIIGTSRGISCANNGSVTINGGTVEGEECGIFSSSGTVTINDGTVVGNKYGIWAYEDTKAYIHGGEIIGKVEGVELNSSSSLEMDKGRIVVENNDPTKESFGILATNSSVTISNAAIIMNNNPDVTTFKDQYSWAISIVLSDLTVEGGTIISTNDAKHTLRIDGLSTKTITGGKFSQDVSEFLSSGYKAVENDGVWEITAA